jgi:hypothetical protein
MITPIRDMTTNVGIMYMQAYIKLVLLWHGTRDQTTEPERAGQSLDPTPRPTLYHTFAYTLIYNVYYFFFNKEQNWVLLKLRGSS